MPTDRPIVFAAKLAGNKFSQLYRIDADGTNRAQLTREPRDLTYPRFSPDGKWIGYKIGYDDAEVKYVIDADGAHKPRPVAKEPEFDWVRDLDRNLSPDGKWELAEGSAGKRGSDVKILLDGVDKDEALCWLDDGHWIVSVSKDASAVRKTRVRVHGTDGKRRHENSIALSKADESRFDDEADYGEFLAAPQRADFREVRSRAARRRQPRGQVAGRAAGRRRQRESDVLGRVRLLGHVLRARRQAVRHVSQS